MQVSSRSWHMRLVRLIWHDYQPKNLCRHFWIVLAMPWLLLLMGVFMTVAVGFLAVLFIGSIFIYGTRAKAAFWDKEDGIRPWWCSAEKQPKQPKQYKVREPNLFIEWIKAKKQKVCPLITVVEAEEN